ncbi:MAG: GntR family transcriptional regulator [Lysobacterales bacterium]
MQRHTAEDSLTVLKPGWDLVSNGVMSRAPLYYQLYTVLRSAIVDGKLQFESQMPSEQKLAEAFDISRITAKRAMDELAEEGLIARFRGKGSHVIYQYAPKPVKAPLVGMLENLIEMGKHSSVRVLHLDKALPPPEIQQQLALPSGENVHELVRVRSNEEDEPFAYYVSWTTGIGKGYTRTKLEKTPRLDIFRDNGLQVVKVNQYLSAETASPKVANELNVKPGTALLAIRRHACVEGGRVVDVLHCLYNPERYTYAMELSLD